MCVGGGRDKLLRGLTSSKASKDHVLSFLLFFKICLFLDFMKVILFLFNFLLHTFGVLCLFGFRIGPSDLSIANLQISIQLKNISVSVALT